MAFGIDWIWFGLVAGAALATMLIEEWLNRKGFEPNLLPLYAVIGSFAFLAFF